MGGIRHEGLSGYIGEINSSNEKLVQLSLAMARAGYVRPLNADMTRAADIVASGRTAVATDTLEFYDPIDGTTLNLGLWQAPVATMTIAQAAGYVTLNNGASVASGAAARLSSLGQFAFWGREVLSMQMRAVGANLPQANVVAELGFGIASGTAVPTDGAFYRWTSGGNFQAVINNGGSETTQTLTAPSDMQAHSYRIEIWHRKVLFYLDQALACEISVPASLANPFAIAHQPIFLRVYNTAAVSLAPQLKLAQAVVESVGGFNEPWMEQLGGMQRHAAVHPATFAQQCSINHTTTNMTLTANTGPAVAAMGGDFLFAAPAGSASEYPIFAYQVPANNRLLVKAVHIDAISYGAAVATTSTILQWYLGINDTATSLATGDAADGSTLGTRRIPLGHQSFPLAGVNGLAAVDIDKPFRVPAVVEGGHYLHVILAVPIGTATASQVIRGTVVISAAME
jgi:hypothetical protein